MGRVDRWAALFVAIAYGLVWLSVGYLIWGRQTETIVEQAAPAIRHADKTLTAARVPGAKLKTPTPSKPRGGRPVRALEATIQPTDPDCPPVTVRADLDEFEDGLRASFAADGGTVTDAVDSPLAPYVRPIAPAWAVGVEYTPETDRYGLAVEKDFGNIRLGASVDEDTARVRALWKIK